ncbi:MAG: hypothetical protein JWP37_2831 [Mucilaginibacter sp.]|nr:hypothetical protein [Mucilaginibacter sp.]
MDLGRATRSMVITHIDPVKKIIAGKFSFATNPIPNKPSRFVDGWFDIVYYTY